MGLDGSISTGLAIVSFENCVAEVVLAGVRFPIAVKVCIVVEVVVGLVIVVVVTFVAKVLLGDEVAVIEDWLLDVGSGNGAIGKSRTLREGGLTRTLSITKPRVLAIAGIGASTCSDIAVIALAPRATVNQVAVIEKYMNLRDRRARSEISTSYTVIYDVERKSYG